MKKGNVIVSITRPVLSDCERQHREDKIRTALQILGKEMNGKKGAA